MDHSAEGGRISSAPTPEETARAYFRAHGEYAPEPEDNPLRKLRIRLGIATVVLVLAAVGGALLLHSDQPSSATTGTPPTTVPVGHTPTTPSTFPPTPAVTTTVPPSSATTTTLAG